MESNETLLQKADITLDALTSGGKLPQEYALTFMRTLVKSSVLTGLVTRTAMKSDTKQIDRIRFNGRVLRPAQEAVALPLADRSRPNIDQVILSAKHFKGEVRISNETMEDNIEGENFKDTIIATLAEAVARDAEDVMINGDTASSDPLFRQFDGLLKQASLHVYDHLDQPANNALFKGMLKVLPKEYRRNKRDLRYLVSGNTEIDWRDALASRQTGFGDNVLTSNAAEVTYTGIPIIDVPLMPEDTGVGNNRAQALLLDPKNATLGVHREIKIEVDKDISAGVYIFVVSMRFDIKYANPDAVAKGIKIAIA